MPEEFEIETLTVEAVWQSFAEDVLAAGIEAGVSLEGARQVFYAGAYSMFSMLKRNAYNARREVQLARIAAWHAELDKFQAEANARAEGKPQ